MALEFSLFAISGKSMLTMMFHQKRREVEATATLLDLAEDRPVYHVVVFLPHTLPREPLSPARGRSCS